MICPSSPSEEPLTCAQHGEKYYISGNLACVAAVFKENKEREQENHDFAKTAAVLDARTKEKLGRVFSYVS